MSDPFRASVSDADLKAAMDPVHRSSADVEVLRLWIMDLEGAIRAALVADGYHPDNTTMLGGDSLLTCFGGVVQNMKPTDDELRTANLNLRSAVMRFERAAQLGEPKPIATAPRANEESVLLYYPVFGWVEGWYFSSPKEIDDGWETNLGSIGEPTHWMPLPKKPQASE